MLLELKNKEYLIIDEFKFKCSIGKKGLNSKKTEGDQCTPIGVFKVGPPELVKKRQTQKTPKTKTQKRHFWNNYDK